MFGEGTLQARVDNESEDAKLQAMGHKTYYETMGGWTKFGEGLLSAFGNMKDKVGDVLSDLNPFNMFKREQKPNEGKNQWWDFLDVFPNPKISNPNDSSELANLLNSSSAQTSLGGMFISPTTIVNNYNTKKKEFQQEESDEKYDLFGNEIINPCRGNDDVIYDLSSMEYLFSKNVKNTGCKNGHYRSNFINTNRYHTDMGI